MSAGCHIVVSFVWNVADTTLVEEWVNDRYPYSEDENLNLAYRVDRYSFAFRFMRDARMFKLVWGQECSP